MTNSRLRQSWLAVENPLCSLEGGRSQEAVERVISNAGLAMAKFDIQNADPLAPLSLFGSRTKICGFGSCPVAIRLLSFWAARSSLPFTFSNRHALPRRNRGADSGVPLDVL